MYASYWGKAQPANDIATPYHLLPYHCLDVAAVGKVYLQHHHRLRQHLAQRLGLDETTFINWQCFFLALHDLGKFSHRFQGMLQKPEDAKPYTQRHDSLGWLLWQAKLAKPVLNQPYFGDDRFNTKRRVFGYWLQSVTGHHGQPPKNFWGDKKAFHLEDQFTEQDICTAEAFSQACMTLFLTETTPPLPPLKTLEAQLKPLSWWLAGIAVLCDWLGSNQTLFPYHDRTIDLGEYWKKHALPQAQNALQQSGVLPLASQQHALTALFTYLKPPTPLQHTAAELDLGTQPQLLILEDVTGSGKTEAALMLVHRLIAAGQADGVYMGLPTMATSNAMFARIEQQALHQRFYQGDGTLLLAHSASKMQQNQTRAEILPFAPAEQDYEAGEDSAANQRGAWLFDQRKKALLADFGVGTIDQALLAVLHSRHQSLRLLGLSRKVLVVDEVHAADVYMQTLLKGLLTFHAAMGGNAILLSATLPQADRQALVDAFNLGLSTEVDQATLEETAAYPLLTRVSAGVCDEVPLATRPEVARRVEVRLVSDVQRVIEQLLAAHQAGHCACWIRNTVDDAREALEMLQEQGVSVESLDLFHARFALGDRLAIEQRVLQRFGKDSEQAERQGQILIATQVVEQSLDLDFDLLISDLAPMDSLIQRAGRLRRHCRDRQGNSRDEHGDFLKQDQRGTAVFYVHSPEPIAEPKDDWFKAVFDKAAYVYPHHGQLWLTARMLKQSGEIRMPEQARALIEGVYGEEAQDRIPEALLEQTWEQYGKALGNRATATQNMIALESGYTSTDLNYWDDSQTPTRLGDPSTLLRLAKWESGELKPWFEAEHFEWQLSQVSIRQSLICRMAEVDDAELQAAMDDYAETVFDKGRWSELLVLQQVSGQWVGEGLGANDQTQRVVYDAELGLRKKT